MFDRFTEQARTAIVLAQEEARAEGVTAVDLTHLAMGCLSQPHSDTARLLATLEIAAGSLVDHPRHVPGIDQRSATLRLAERVKRALESSMRLAMTLGNTMVTSAHVLVAVVGVDPDGEVGGALLRAGADLPRLELTLSTMQPQEFIESGRQAAGRPQEDNV